MTWSIQDIWNKKVVSNQRPPKVRDYISASDIGSPFIDRYYKMKGLAPTNPFDERTLRIFDAGKNWEQMLVRIFKMAGILISTQNAIEIPATKDKLKVIGFLDCILGGKPDPVQAKKAIQETLARFGLDEKDEFMEQRALGLVDELSKQFPKGLSPIVAEIKSVNSMAFWAHKNADSKGYFKGYPHHKLQLLTYLLGKPTDDEGNVITEGRMFYVSKDDLCLQETEVKMDQRLLALWEQDIKTMTKYIQDDVVPPVEDDIIWNEDKKSYEINWRVGRSPFLTKIKKMSKDQWEMKANSEARKMTLDYKWRSQAKELGLDTDGHSIDDIKKEVMKLNRIAKKIVIEREEFEPMGFIN